jgi:hypothetical protein
MVTLTVQRRSSQLQTSRKLCKQTQQAGQPARSWAGLYRHTAYCSLYRPSRQCTGCSRMLQLRQQQTSLWRRGKPGRAVWCLL